MGRFLVMIVTYELNPGLKVSTMTPYFFTSVYVPFLLEYL